MLVRSPASSGRACLAMICCILISLPFTGCMYMKGCVLPGQAHHLHHRPCLGRRPTCVITGPSRVCVCEEGAGWRVELSPCRLGGVPGCRGEGRWQGNVLEMLVLVLHRQMATRTWMIVLNLRKRSALASADLPHKAVPWSLTLVSRIFHMRSASLLYSRLLEARDNFATIDCTIKLIGPRLSPGSSV